MEHSPVENVVEDKNRNARQNNIHLADKYNIMLYNTM